jgi:hypothetical protein
MAPSMRSSARAPHMCPYCHRRLPTHQGVRVHITHRKACQEAHLEHLAEAKIRVYNPEDPEDHPHDNEPHHLDDEMDTSDQTPFYLDALDGEAHGTSEDAMPTDMHMSDSGPIMVAPDTTYCRPFPGIAGVTYGQTITRFKALVNVRAQGGVSIYHPFADRAKWELAETLMTSGMSLGMMDKVLKLPIVCHNVIEP